jgi:hypothetical protein
VISLAVTTWGEMDCVGNGSKPALSKVEGNCHCVLSKEQKHAESYKACADAYFPIGTFTCFFLANSFAAW